MNPTLSEKYVELYNKAIIRIFPVDTMVKLFGENLESSIGHWKLFFPPGVMDSFKPCETSRQILTEECKPIFKQKQVFLDFIKDNFEELTYANPENVAKVQDIEKNVKDFIKRMGVKADFTKSKLEIVVTLHDIISNLSTTSFDSLHCQSEKLFIAILFAIKKKVHVFDLVCDYELKFKFAESSIGKSGLQKSSVICSGDTKINKLTDPVSDLIFTLDTTKLDEAEEAPKAEAKAAPKAEAKAEAKAAPKADIEGDFSTFTLPPRIKIKPAPALGAEASKIPGDQEVSFLSTESKVPGLQNDTSEVEKEKANIEIELVKLEKEKETLEKKKNDFQAVIQRRQENESNEDRKELNYKVAKELIDRVEKELTDINLKILFNKKIIYLIEKKYDLANVNFPQWMSLIPKSYTLYMDMLDIAGRKQNKDEDDKKLIKDSEQWINDFKEKQAELTTGGSKSRRTRRRKHNRKTHHKRARKTHHKRVSKTYKRRRHSRAVRKHKKHTSRR
jgi:outer membrane murein-binding lipoprotein Lpp